MYDHFVAVFVTKHFVKRLIYNAMKRLMESELKLAKEVEVELQAQEENENGQGLQEVTIY